MDNENMNKSGDDDSTSVPISRNPRGHSGEIMNRRSGGNPLWSGWDPFPDFRRAFAEITDTFERFSRQIINVLASPKVEISRSDGNLVVKITIPGLNKNNLDVEVYDDYIRLAGKQNRKNEYGNPNGNTYRCEESYNAFFKIFPLPARVKQDEAKIEYRGDVVFITIPEA